MTSPVTVTFHPQAWIGDYACPVDPQGPTTWQVDASELVGLVPDDYSSDNLRYHANAPAWVAEWGGPFFIDWETDNT